MIDIVPAAQQAVRRVCVAVPTFRRPRGLANVLRALANQIVCEPYRLTILVVDNDNVPSARATIDEMNLSATFALVYRHVPKPGLSSVRNAMIDYARDRFDYLAMIDDDEVPVTRWLQALLDVERSTGCDAVIGPVPQQLSAQTPRWIRAGRFFDLPVYENEARIGDGYSGNCLLNMSSLRKADVRFDPALNFAGGEDMLFFRQLAYRGFDLRYASKAVAREEVPEARQRVAYLLRLNFRRGNTLSMCDRRVAPTKMKIALRASKAFARVTLGMIMMVPLGLFRGRTGLMIALCSVAQGVGSFSGLGGYVYHAYKRVDS